MYFELVITVQSILDIEVEMSQIAPSEQYKTFIGFEC